MSNEVNDPNKAVNSSATHHYRPDENGEPKLWGFSRSAGVKSLRLDVATQLLAGLAAAGRFIESDVGLAVRMSDELIERCSHESKESE